MAVALDTAQLQYGQFYLPSKYTNILIPNFFYNTFLQAGVTYTDKYRMSNAGQIFVPRLKPGNVTVTTPCSEFEHQDIGNELLQITLNTTFMSSKKICELVSTVAEYPLMNEVMQLSAKELAEAFNKAGIAALVTEGVGQTVQAPIPANLDELKNDILSAKTQLYVNKRKPSVMLCSPYFYQMVLQYAGTLFTPGINDRMVYSGEVGTWLGLRFINCNLLQSAAATEGDFQYYDYKWDEHILQVSEVGEIAYILYDAEAFSVLVNFSRSRFIGTPAFMGGYVQTVLNSGFRVTDPASVFIRKYGWLQGNSQIPNLNAAKTSIASLSDTTAKIKSSK